MFQLLIPDDMEALSKLLVLDIRLFSVPPPPPLRDLKDKRSSRLSCLRAVEVVLATEDVCRGSTCPTGLSERYLLPSGGADTADLDLARFNAKALLRLYKTKHCKKLKS